MGTHKRLLSFSPVAKPPVLHVNDASIVDSSFLNTAHSAWEGKLDSTPVTLHGTMKNVANEIQEGKTNGNKGVQQMAPRRVTCVRQSVQGIENATNWKSRVLRVECWTSLMNVRLIHDCSH